MNKIVLTNCETLEPSTLSALKDKCTELGYELVEEEKLKEFLEEKGYTIMQPPHLSDITMLDSPISNCKKSVLTMRVIIFTTINVSLNVERKTRIRKHIEGGNNYGSKERNNNRRSFA